MLNTYSLLCYTREATSREEANNEDIAYSMHLALRFGNGDDSEWRRSMRITAFSLPLACPSRRQLENLGAPAPPRRIVRSTRSTLLVRLPTP